MAALAGVGEVLVKLDEVGEGVVDLRLGEGGVAGAAHGRLRRDLADLVEGIGADELALAVEVGADDDGVGLLGEVLERADDALLGGELLDGSPHEVRQARDLPALDVDAVLEIGLALAVIRRAREAVRQVGGELLALRGQAVPALLFVEVQLRREVRRQDVAAQADGHPVLAVAREAVDRRVIYLVCLGTSGLAQEAGDLLGSVIFLCNN